MNMWSFFSDPATPVVPVVSVHNSCRKRVEDSLFSDPHSPAATVSERDVCDDGGLIVCLRRIF